MITFVEDLASFKDEKIKGVISISRITSPKGKVMRE